MQATAPEPAAPRRQRSTLERLRDELRAERDKIVRRKAVVAVQLDALQAQIERFDTALAALSPEPPDASDNGVVEMPA